MQGRRAGVEGTLLGTITEQEGAGPAGDAFGNGTVSLWASLGR